jgi:Undecaprenyl-phosphate galactose phosphotransferase WbaP
VKEQRHRSNRGEITLALIVVDLLAVAASFAVSYTLRRYAPLLSPLQHGPEVYVSAWPALLLWTLAIWREGLYPGFWLTAREELRRVVTATTLASLLAVAATFVTQAGIQFSRPIVVGGWLISLVFLPAARFAVRVVLTRAGLTGPPAVILGAGKTAGLILAGLRRQRPPALWPVALFDDDPSKLHRDIDGVPVVGPLKQAAAWAGERGIRTAVVAMPGVGRERLIPIVEAQSRSFQRIIVVPDLFGLSGSEMDPRDVQGVLALELRKNLLYRRNLIAKRAVDLALLIISLPISVPAETLMAVAVWLDGGGPVFFRQDRIGKGGRGFKAWKFRTMVPGAEEVLRKALAQDPALQAEWQASQKLRRDPRLTRVGRFLRRTSMDELPQLWNVLRGEMSLVGPRPIVHEEITRYGEGFDLYCQVPPGLTGLWQVSGRSDTTYQERVWLDTHYVRNWSIWLDLVILVRTVWVVVAGIGAY